MLGLVEAELGDLPAARKAFQRGIWAAPLSRAHSAYIWQAWALMEEKAGDAPLARAYLRRGAEADPESVRRAARRARRAVCDVC